MTLPDDVHDRVAAIVAELFMLSRVEVHGDLGYGGIEAWDSVGHLDLLVALERAFGFTLTVELIPQLTSIRAIEEFLASRVAA
jgi:acyl carrier protein